jgi:hypothetical protein
MGFIGSYLPWPSTMYLTTTRHVKPSVRFIDAKNMTSGTTGRINYRESRIDLRAEYAHHRLQMSCSCCPACNCRHHVSHYEDCRCRNYHGYMGIWSRSPQQSHSNRFSRCHSRNLYSCNQGKLWFLPIIFVFYSLLAPIRSRRQVSVSNTFTNSK